MEENGLATLEKELTEEEKFSLDPIENYRACRKGR